MCLSNEFKFSMNSVISKYLSLISSNLQPYRESKRKLIFHWASMQRWQYLIYNVLSLKGFVWSSINLDIPVFCLNKLFILNCGFFTKATCAFLLKSNNEDIIRIKHITSFNRTFFCMKILYSGSFNLLLFCWKVNKNKTGWLGLNFVLLIWSANFRK